MALSRDLPMVDKLDSMKRALDRETQPVGEATLQLSRALLLGFLGQSRAGNAEAKAVILEHGETSRS